MSELPTSSSSAEEEDDVLDDYDDEFSFYNFSRIHFQNNATHTHVSHRLKKPLLHHDDEADALVRGREDTQTAVLL